MCSIIKYLQIAICLVFILNQSRYVHLDQQLATINDLLSSNCLFYGCQCVYNQIKCPTKNTSHQHPPLIMFPKRHFLSNYLSIRIDLDLSENRLQSIPDDRLAFLNIKKLNLSNNELSRFSPDAFRDITRLDCLDLSSNQLDYLNMDLFKPISLSLTELIFKFNRLNHMETTRLSSILSDLKRLLTLNLAYNNLTYMPNLKEISTLKYLNLEHNTLEYLTDSDTNEQLLPNSLIRLNLEYNELKHLNENSFGRLNKLEYLNLAHNQISEIAEDTFVHLTNLIEINLSFNHFKHIPSRIFFNLINLNHLDLSSQKLPIRLIDNYAFDRKSNRKTIGSIDLSSNQIELISSRAFCSRTSISKYINIREIDLSENRITKLDVCVLHQLSAGNQFSRVQLKLNSTFKFECSCDLTRLAQIDICANCNNYTMISIEKHCSKLTQYECITEPKITKPFLIYLKKPTAINISYVNNYTNRFLIKNIAPFAISFNLNDFSNSTFNSSKSNESPAKWSFFNLNILIVCLFMVIFSVK